MTLPINTANSSKMFNLALRQAGAPPLADTLAALARMIAAKRTLYARGTNGR